MKKCKVNVLENSKFKYLLIGTDALRSMGCKLDFENNVLEIDHEKVEFLTPDELNEVKYDAKSLPENIFKYKRFSPSCANTKEIKWIRPQFCDMPIKCVKLEVT